MFPSVLKRWECLISSVFNDEKWRSLPSAMQVKRQSAQIDIMEYVIILSLDNLKDYFGTRLLSNKSETKVLHLKKQMKKNQEMNECMNNRLNTGSYDKNAD